MTGAGLAADRATPGDLLYPFDRALEALGLSTDLVEERLQEAITLAERGDMALAVATANEALDELNRSGVTHTLPTVATLPDVTTAAPADEVSTTTTQSDAVEVAPHDGDDVDTEADAGETVAAADEPVSIGESLRLAAEQLLHSVRSAKTDPTTSGDVTSAAMFLAETTASVSVDTAETLDSTTTTSTSPTTSTTSTTTPSTTTTTVAETRPGNRSGDSGTTTTTVASDPDDGSGSDDSAGDGEADSPGPIFLPSP